jgi:hypothetical protein
MIKENREAARPEHVLQHLRVVCQCSAAREHKLETVKAKPARSENETSENREVGGRAGKQDWT